MDYYDQQVGTKTYQSTVNGLKFSIPEDDENSQDFFGSVSMQHFIVPEHHVLHDKKPKKAASGLGEIEIVDKTTPKTTTAKTKTTRTTRQPKTAKTTKTDTAPNGNKGTVELE